MGASLIIRYLRDLFDVNTTGAAPGDVLGTTDGVNWTPQAGGGGGGGAPVNAEYLVGTANATLTNEIVVGTTPGGELGNTWASPTVDTVHSGSSHAQTQAAAEATAAAALNAHVTDPTDAHDASAISNIPAGTIASTDLQGAINELDGQITTSLSDAVILAPASSARNVIQPTAGSVIAAILKAHAAQSVDLMRWVTSADAILAQITANGRLAIGGDIAGANLPRARFVVFDNGLASTDEYVTEIHSPQKRSPFAYFTDDDRFGGAYPWVTGFSEYVALQNFGQDVFLFYYGMHTPDTEPAHAAFSFYREGSSNGIEFGANSASLAGALADEEWIYVTSYLDPPATAPWRFYAAKRMLVWRTAATDNAKLAAGEFGTWLDPTNGAAKMMHKGKTADGTVVTFTQPSGTVYVAGGTDVALADGGTGASLTDPNADRIMFWDDSAGSTAFLAPGTGLTITGTTIDATAGAPTTATYITQTADAGLSAEQALSSLATGLVKNTTGTGVLSIGAAGTDYYAPGSTDVAVADGGTGSSTSGGARTNLGLVIGTDVAAQSDVRFASHENGHAGVLAPTTLGWTMSGTAFVANRCLLARFVPTKNLAITKIAFMCQLAGAAGNKIDVGIYSSDLATRLGSSGSIVTSPTMASAGLKVLSLTGTVNLVAGTTYYAAIVPDTTAGQYAAAMINNLGTAGSESMFGATIGEFETGIKDVGSGVLPTSIATPTPSSYQGCALAVRES